MHANVKVRPNPAKCTQAQGEPGLKHERITVLWYSKLYSTARCTAVRGRGNTPLTLSPYYNKKMRKKKFPIVTGNPALKVMIHAVD